MLKYVRLRFSLWAHNHVIVMGVSIHSGSIKINIKLAYGSVHHGCIKKAYTKDFL